MLRTKHDDIFSKIIRERADWTCEKCGRDYHANRAGLHCSHVYGRRRMSVRYDIDNAMAHCVYCHKILGENPIEFTKLYMEKYGQGRLDLLTEKANSTRKWSPPSKKTGYKGEKEEMYKHYKGELNRLLALRAEGVKGWIEVINF